MKDLIEQLPTINKNLLKELCLFLQKITENRDVNKMDADNLSKTFGPNLLRFPDSNDIQLLVKETAIVSKITTIMISNASEIFNIVPIDEIVSIY